jgi:UDP-N-acetylmuramoyl-tripeptide--D-alanyl-D-alanine ligase
MKSFVKSIIVSILIAEAKWLLQRHQPTIVAVTGSVGKTTTKDAIFAAIKNSVHARKSERSFNSEIGVPLTVLGLSNGWSNPFIWIKNIIDGFFTALFSKDYPDILILEAGIDRPGDMDRLTNWLKPDMVVLTRLPSVPVHVEFFAKPEAVCDEKMKLVAAMKPEGVFIYNHDDVVIQSRLDDVLQRSVGFSRYLPSVFMGSNDRIVYNDDKPVGVEFVVNYQKDAYTIRVNDIVGTQQVYACAAALAVAAELEVPLDEAVVSLRELRVPNGRMHIVAGLKATTIIDDTYNSSPTAVEQALQTLNEIKYAKRKIVVLGDMLELGRFSSDEHYRIGTMIPPIAKVLITVGIRARKFAEGALAAGMPEKSILQYDDSLTAGKELQSFLQPGDVVLVKASQGIRAEKIVEEIMAEPELASDLLVRQETFWKR